MAHVPVSYPVAVVHSSTLYCLGPVRFGLILAETISAAACLYKIQLCSWPDQIPRLYSMLSERALSVILSFPPHRNGRPSACSGYGGWVMGPARSVTSIYSRNGGVMRTSGGLHARFAALEAACARGLQLGRQSHIGLSQSPVALTAL